MDDLLWSINEKLSGREGLSIERLDDMWVKDLIAIVTDEDDETPMPTMPEDSYGDLGLL